MYIVKKDGLYLIGYLDTGIREMDLTGEYRQIPTGLYGSDRKDAVIIQSAAFAVLFGGEIFDLVSGRTIK